MAEQNFDGLEFDRNADTSVQNTKWPCMIEMFYDTK